MIQIGGKIPITIHFFFWITAALIGFLNSGTWIGTLIWIFVILVSVLVHEMGHALTAVFFGLRPRIELVALGGLTYHQGEKLPFWKQFFIVLNGPVFGFLLFVLAGVFLKFGVAPASFGGGVLKLFYWVNLVWTILNLIPVMPLDGGQLLRIVLESFFGAKGFRYSLIIGMGISGVISLGFFLYQQYLIGALFFLFAFQSWDMFRRLKLLSNVDRSDQLKTALAAAERNLQEGEKDKALFAFDRIRLEAKEGMIYMMATQYVAFLKYDLGKVKEAYDLLIPLRAELPPEALCLLHKAAFEVGDFSIVEQIGGDCYQVLPGKEIALRNAIACAALTKAKPAVGWLETAFQDGLENIGAIIKGKEFDPIRDTPYFQQFMKNHSEE